MRKTSVQQCFTDKEEKMQRGLNTFTSFLKHETQKLGIKVKCFSLLILNYIIESLS